MIKLDCGNGIEVTLHDATALLDVMTPEQRLQLIESLSCYDEVIKHVADQISNLYGCTENGCSGTHTITDKAYAGGGSALDAAKFQVAREAGEVAMQLIDKQAQVILQQAEEIDSLRKTIAYYKNPDFSDILGR